MPVRVQVACAQFPSSSGGFRRVPVQVLEASGGLRNVGLECSGAGLEPQLSKIEEALNRGGKW